ncbi:cell division ATP-binding protein FtsE [Deinococcus proteolyticus MRP]|uniref:Cell division ATP-binding protein FtsE n=1 Tax=Deinococcus proteolyticus (strain ATCC 35074 / DSM 20540 / JCM 6276 / NBRC 101906 / NCIMB 13154 / VKM Ac-1939 / CCM 2703 / MRP) TaxID=693977 RepID=F0RN27_DEIPM|nr:cell division ATP-binding protein FtsE [Deinococcus proteolyticus]ADY26169.1 cell division ATP-binding protein FtsE [Deinococcus proteolyticus MRP]
MIHFDQVSLQYPSTRTLALNRISTEVARGEFVYLIGHSGAGKSSFMSLLLKRALPTAGEVRVAGEPLGRYRGGRVSVLRRRMGIIFQENMLLPQLTAYQNVAFALRVTEAPRVSSLGSWNERVGTALRLVGLEHKRAALPHQLSQGEQQRVAIARAVVGAPALLLADEPTGNLDPENSRDVLRVLERVNESGTTVLVATHARELVESRRHRTLTLRRGELVRDDAGGGYQL